MRSRHFDPQRCGRLVRREQPRFIHHNAILATLVATAAALGAFVFRVWSA